MNLHPLKPLVIAAASFSMACPALAEVKSVLAFAEDLVANGNPAQGALEYRRLAADSGDPAFRGACYLLAADAYRAVPAPPRMNLMLDHAEEEGASDTPPGTWLRMQSAELDRDWASAALYAEDLANAAGGDARLARYARRSAAANFLRANATDDAKAALGDDSSAQAAIDRYLAGHDKSPRIGGLLGIIPGLGYAYSGEWGNMFRSIFLNGIFGWAMFECADREQWGLFAVTTFFELTWYSGSIYGGIDAAHRYSRNRLDTAVREIRGDDVPHISNEARLEVLSLRLSF
jgi:hypothetical protein